MINLTRPKPPILAGWHKNPRQFEKDLQNKSEDYWIKKGEQRALKLFHLMSKRVPAYKDFLKKNHIRAESIKTIQDFIKIPTLDKDNYLRAYPIEMLCWDGNFNKKRWTISTNSGSTGEVYYFPREIDQDYIYSLTAELYLRNNFDIANRTTLYIDTFAMGAWIGGVFTFEAIRLLAERGKYNLSIITPGIFKEEILKAVVNLGNKYDQIIIGGYPPFVKDILDEGKRYNISWKKYNIGVVFSAEGFTEKFRDYILNKISAKNIYTTTLNHYGTADMGTMSYETPISVMVRKNVVGDKLLLKKVFPENNRIPTFTQYDPTVFYFETVDNVLCCTGYSGIPFVRYNLKDNGGIMKFSEVETIYNQSGQDLYKLAKNSNIQNTVWKLPFVYLYERNDFTVKLYGANIFPDSIRHVLQQKRFQKKLSGKFTMVIMFDDNQNQYLEVNVELMSGTAPSVELKEKIEKSIVKCLLEENSEYKSNYRSNPQRQTPTVSLWEYENGEYFKTGGKHKWIKKN